MHADGNRESSCNGCDDGGYRKRKRKLADLTILKWQCVVIWMPSQIFERSEEGASSRKGACPFAFACQSADDFAIVLRRAGMCAQCGAVNRNAEGIIHVDFPDTFLSRWNARSLFPGKMLLRAQRFDGIDGGGAARGQQRAGEGEHGQDADGGEQRERVALRGVDELALREVARGEGER